jgi:hypothetical protein
MSDDIEELTQDEEGILQDAIESLQGNAEDMQIVRDLLQEVKSSLESYPSLKEKQKVEEALRNDAISAMKELSKAKTPEEKAFLRKGAAASAISAGFVHNEIERLYKVASPKTVDEVHTEGSPTVGIAGVYKGKDLKEILAIREANARQGDESISVEEVDRSGNYVSGMQGGSSISTKSKTAKEIIAEHNKGRM